MYFFKSVLDLQENYENSTEKSIKLGFPGGARVPVQETKEMEVQSLGREDPLEKQMATHSSILAWEILWTEESGRLQSMGLQRVGHTTE